MGGDEENGGVTQNGSVTFRDTVRDPRGPTVIEIGATIAQKYKIVKQLGAGGMGVVFAARHLELGRLVAIKILHGDSLDETDVARFLREAKAAAALTSEHAVRVHDMGLLPSGHPFLVMEHLEGQDLGRYLARRGPLRLEKAIDCMLQVCEVLAEAHAAGIIHRDVKPQNVFIVSPKTHSDTLRIKVLDFGLVKLATPIRDGTQLTQEHALLGSPRFMSPEQIESARTVDARTDVWSVGATLYNLLSGEPPFPGKTVPEVLGRVLLSPPAPLRERRPDVSPELEAVVLRCLSKSPDGRFASIGELGSALRAARAPAARAVRVPMPVPMPVPISRDAKRAGVAILLGGALFLVAIPLLAWWLSGATRRGDASPAGIASVASRPVIAPNAAPPPVATPSPSPSSNERESEDAGDALVQHEEAGVDGGASKAKPPSPRRATKARPGDTVPTARVPSCEPGTRLVFGDCVPF